MNESHLQVLKILKDNPKVSQRDIAKKLTLSLGKVNYVLNALIEKGYVKMQRFKGSNKKLAYLYVLTPRGFGKKVELTHAFLKRKSREYEALKKEIHELRHEVKALETEKGKEEGHA